MQPLAFRKHQVNTPLYNLMSIEIQLFCKGLRGFLGIIIEETASQGQGTLTVRAKLCRKYQQN